MNGAFSAMFSKVVAHCQLRIEARLYRRVCHHPWRVYTLKPAVEGSFLRLESIMNDTRFLSLYQIARMLAEWLSPDGDGPYTLKGRSYTTLKLEQVSKMCARMTLCPDPADKTGRTFILDVLENKLKSEHFANWLAQRQFSCVEFLGAVHHIRQLARYDTGCGDLLRIAVTYPTLFSNRLSVVHNVNEIWRRDYGGVLLYGEDKRGCVHAEIWQVLYHELLEQNYPQRLKTRSRPRLIGCNKSACFLREQFLMAHGQYKTSKAHNRIYLGWRIPVATSMGAALQQRLSGVAKEMVRSMNQIEKSIDAETQHEELGSQYRAIYSGRRVRESCAPRQ